MKELDTNEKARLRQQAGPDRTGTPSVGRTPQQGPDAEGGEETTGQPFIPAKLDDAGLTTAQFRIFCHITRVGDCWQSVQTIAETCKIHPDTVWPAIAELIRRRMLSRIQRPGKTSMLKPLPVSSWTPTGKRGAPENEGHPSVSSGPTGKRGVTTHWKRRGRKVIPLKVIPIREGLAPKSRAVDLSDQL